MKQSLPTASPKHSARPVGPNFTASVAGKEKRERARIRAKLTQREPLPNPLLANVKSQENTVDGKKKKIQQREVRLLFMHFSELTEHTTLTREGEVEFMFTAAVLGAQAQSEWMDVLQQCRVFKARICPEISLVFLLLLSTFHRKQIPNFYYRNCMMSSAFRLHNSEMVFLL